MAGQMVWLAGLWKNNGNWNTEGCRHSRYINHGAVASKETGSCWRTMRSGEGEGMGARLVPPAEGFGPYLAGAWVVLSCGVGVTLTKCPTTSRCRNRWSPVSHRRQGSWNVVCGRRYTRNAGSSITVACFAGGNTCQRYTKNCLKVIGERAGGRPGGQPMSGSNAAR